MLRGDKKRSGCRSHGGKPREISLEDFFESMDKDERMGGWNEGETSEDI